MLFCWKANLGLLKVLSRSMGRAHDEDIESNNGLSLCFSTEELLMAPGRSWVHNCLFCIISHITFVLHDIVPHIGAVIEESEVTCGPADGSTVSNTFEGVIELCFQRAVFAKKRTGKTSQHEPNELLALRP